MQNNFELKVIISKNSFESGKSRKMCRFSLQNQNILSNQQNTIFFRFLCFFRTS